MMVTLAVVPSVPDTFTNTLKSVVFLINTLIGSYGPRMYLCLPLLFSKKWVGHKYTYNPTKNEVKSQLLKQSGGGLAGQAGGNPTAHAGQPSTCAEAPETAHTATQGATRRGSCAGAAHDSPSLP